MKVIHIFHTSKLSQEMDGFHYTKAVDKIFLKRQCNFGERVQVVLVMMLHPRDNSGFCCIIKHMMKD